MTLSLSLVVVMLDGQDPITLHDGDRIVIRRRTEPLHLVHPKGHDHYDVLRAKLHWAREL